MAKKFGGFTDEQMKAIAQRMGFDGPMHKFNEFLATSPDNATKLARYAEKARSIVEGESGPPTAAFATGGVIQPQKGDDPARKAELEKTHVWDSNAKVWRPKESTATTSNSKTTSGSQASFVDTTGQQMVTNPQKVATPATPSTIAPKSGEFINKGAGDLGEFTNANVNTVKDVGTAKAANPGDAATYDAKGVTKKVDQTLEGVEAAQGTVSDKSQVVAATALPSADATVAGQLEKLYAQFEGGATPPWAAGAKRMADTVMASRGLGASSMAVDASTQAMMESALQIAIQDAQTFSAFEMQNLNNRQQARVINAQAFLQMDMANLDNEQQTTLFKAQSRIQSLFTDQAAENAARQFNATSVNQQEQFFAQLKTQVSQFNTSQRNAMRQYNTEQKNAIQMFNKNLKNQRDQFEANNRLIIDQANASWRQKIATTNNAEQNESNRLNAQLLTGMTTAAYNNLWQTERDLMAYAFTASENAETRKHEVVLQKMGDKSASSVAKGQAAGSLVGTIVDKGATALFNKWLG